MIRLEQISRTYGDCTADYSVTLNKPYTVKEFISEVLTRGEWGYIGIKSETRGCFFGSPNCEYRKDVLLNTLPTDYLDKPIEKVTASGGWSRMDYLIELR